MKFSDYQLDPALQAGIDKLGYAACTPIQEQAIGPILEGKDVAGLAQTGTGKTAAFLIPIIERILRSQAPIEGADEEQMKVLEKRIYKDWKSNQFVLILVPTRELAEQVQENLASIASQANIKGFAIYGGTGYDRQKEALKSGLQFVIATPGRLIDLYKEHLVDLKQVRAIIFDEADRMFDMGFKDDMKYVLQRVPNDRQFLVFSATLNFDVLNTAYQFGADPVELNVSRDQAKADNVKDEIFHVGNDEKPRFLLSVLKLKQPKQAIIFSNFKHNVDRIAKFLNDNGISGMAISSLLTQAQRTKVMQQFKEENEHNILVATDVAARGLDIQGVDMVINYELPMDSESYVHRIGRTGRAGATGQAYSLVSDRDIESLSRIEDYLKHKLEIGFIEDKDLVVEFKHFPQGDLHIHSGMNSIRGGSGDRRPPRRDDRGPRHEGGRKEGGGRPRHEGGRPEGGGGNRGPRNEAPRADGMKYDEKGRPQPSANAAELNRARSEQAPSAKSRPRHEGGRHEGGRHEGGKPQHGNKSHQKSAAQGGQNKNGAGARAGNRTRNHSRDRSKQTPTPTKAPVGNKIVGFLKRLFGS